MRKYSSVDILKKIFRDKVKILCMEHAAAYHGLLEDVEFPMEFYYSIYEDFCFDTDSLKKGYYIPREHNLSFTDAIYITKTVGVTTIEQTICDMIVDEKQLNSICSAIVAYYNRNGMDVSSLIAKAGVEGVGPRLKDILEDILHID